MTPAPVILIVEDEAIVANDLRETLTGLGYGVAGTAKSGELALQKIAETRPDLVLMDIHLAGAMDGIEAAGQIHSAYGIPVIYMTAYADDALLERAKFTEPYGYIVKPYEERGLHSAIEMALYKHGMERRVQESEATTRVLINATKDLLYLISADGRILVANEALAGRARTKTGDLVGTSAYELVGKKVLTPKMACWNIRVEGEKRLHTVEQLNNSWFDVTVFPVYDGNGSVEKFAVIVRNITAKKQAEEQLKNNAEYFRLLIEEVSEVVVMLNSDGSFALQSPSLSKALGYTKYDDLKQSLFDYISQSDWQEVKPVLSEIIAHPGMAKPFLLKCKKRDGTVCVIKGIMSNQTNNPSVGKIVLSGWVA